MTFIKATLAVFLGMVLFGILTLAMCVHMGDSLRRAHDLAEQSRAQERAAATRSAE